MRKIVRAASLALVTTLSIQQVGQAQQLSTQDVCERAQGILLTISEFHWQPLELNDSLSSRVYDLWLEGLDPRGRLFTQESLAEMEAFRYRLDDQLDSDNCAFLRTMTALYESRLQAMLDLLTKLEVEPLNYQEEEYMYTSRGYQLTSDSASWANLWRRRTKMEVLDKVYWWRDTLDLTEEKVYFSFLAQEPSWRHSWLDEQRCRIRRVLNQEDQFEEVAEAFLQALATAHDPHTMYFSPIQKEQFEESLSTDRRSFGLELAKNSDGEWSIENLTPGGPAWHSNQLHTEDVVLELRLGNNPPVELGCLDTEEVYYLVAGTEEEEMHLKVRQTSGTVMSLSLKKAHVAVEENTIHSMLLDGDHKVGYVSLPSFYTSFENDDDQGCSDDVAKEIIRLNRAGMEGLVLDLRYNGGGSIREAMNLAGIFVDYGPLTLEHVASEEVTTLRDWNRGAIYRGPLVVLVNGSSASASEILAATLQDWQKALIVGSPTYGKATGQLIVPVGVSPQSQMKFALAMRDSKMGYLKVTTSAYYRLNGEAYQARGIEPDVMVPNVWERFFSYENEEPYHLKTGSVEKKVYFTPEALPRTDIQQLSQKRMEADTLMVQWANMRDKVGQLIAEGASLPLRWEDYMTFDQNNMIMFQQIDQLLERKAEAYSVVNLPDMTKLLKLDQVRAQQNEQLVKSLESDPVLEEAYHVLGDWINLHHK